MKIGRSVEAVDVAYTFGVEETFHPQQAVVAVCGGVFFFFFCFKKFLDLQRAMSVFGSGWWVAAVLWLFVVLFEVGMWWWGYGGWVFFFCLIRVAVVFWCV